MLRKALASFCLTSCLSIALTAQTLANPQTYTVTSGDTLSAIADRFHVSVEQLVRYNHLQNADTLSLGQVLRLAPSPVKLAAHRAGTTRFHGARVAARTRKHPAIALRHRAPRVVASAESSSAHLAELEGLWIATHAGAAPPSFEGSFASAQRLVALELQLTRTALRYLGVPYEWGGESFSGVDCSGFVQAVFRHNGIDLPRTADAQFEVGQRVAMSGLEPGDLVFFQTYAEGASHVGIYLGDGRFVHASASDGVRVDSLSEDYYSSRYIGARRTI
ncbi:MAG TPA: NlpC/P60 family protein [Candidatus Acidoferrales bacterium]|nr:NlpC/P60 family protein [Candidatus Acidoferrales bacterium]